MSARTILAFLVALIPAAATAASPAPPVRPEPPLPILKLANAVVNASNRDDAPSLSTLYTNDAIVVDEIPPFLWRGAGVGVAWWRAVEAFIRKEHHRLRLVNVRISDFQRSAQDGYLIQAMTILETGNGPSAGESGTLTYTFHDSGGTWLISSQVWTTKPE
ncbi:MAG: hypothetical protein JO078_04290 [Candidatus Eremiobacteraeota bacterium]|nr:hypothetical protein [Candidatus Eremiobacteraeota bacterium]